MTRIAILGMGNIGSRHVDNLLALGEEDLVGYDLSPDNQEERLPVVDRLEDLLAFKPTHALVCTPPATHAVLATALLDAGLHVFVEKPLATTGKEAQRMVNRARKNGCQLAVGYNLRAHEQLWSCPRRWRRLDIVDRQDWSTWPAATYSRSLLQEFSHELDLVYALAGPRARWVGVELRAQSAELEFHVPHNGPVIVHLDAAHDTYDRCVFASNGWEWRFTREDNDEAYRNELAAFLRGEPYATGEDGLRVCCLLDELGG